MPQIEVFEVRQSHPEYVAAVNALLSQLCSSPCTITADGLQQIADEPNSRLLLLAVDGSIAGMCTVAFYRAPTGRKAWIEDVVVDEAYRGQHLGKQLVERAVEFARKEGFDSLMLTSRPARVAANEMYRKLGFRRKETNVYRM